MCVKIYNIQIQDIKVVYEQEWLWNNFGTL